MSDIKWETPPSQSRGPGSTKYADVADALRGRPGQWALIGEDMASSLVTIINKGRSSAFSPAGAFEARGATVKLNRSKVWARFVGGSA